MSETHNYLAVLISHLKKISISIVKSEKILYILKVS